jgi:hypothetical protein
VDFERLHFRGGPSEHMPREEGIGKSAKLAFSRNA